MRDAEWERENDLYNQYDRVGRARPMTRKLSDIASEIDSDWSIRTGYSARPYLDAMGELDSIDDAYGFDTGRSIVLYFLSNASSWRGETARRIKAELKGMLK